jgi:two-component system CitB family response regulator
MSQQLRVLIADDDFHVARLHTGVVESTPGFTCLPSVGTGEAVLRAVAQSAPDLVLLDVYLPDISGLDVLARVDVDCFVISAASDPTSVRRALRRGAMCYLIKPFPEKLLRDRLQSYGKYRESLREESALTQDVLERMLRALHPAENGTAQPRAVTEAAVLHVLSKRPEPASAAEIASAIGVSRATAQRYLSALVDAGAAKVQLRYGNTGRPEHRYTLPQ